MMLIDDIDAAVRPWPRAVQAALALAAAGLALFLPVHQALGSVLVSGALAVIALTDWRLRRIPDLMLGALVAGGLLRLADTPEAFAARLIFAGLAIAGLLALRRVVSNAAGRPALGLGDVKLAASAALLVAPEHFGWMIATAAGAGVIHGLLQPHTARAGLPFGTWLALGLALFLLAGAG